MRKLCKDLIRQAKQLANFDNSSFISFGEMFNYLNDAYRAVYVDMITNGDLTYIKELELGNGRYTLPNDFFQLAYIKSGDTELERDYDYVILNGSIEIKHASDVTLAYYPTPTTITFKPEKKDLTLPIAPISAWNTNVISSTAQIYNIQTETFVKETTSEVGSYILGENTYLDIVSNIVYDFNGATDFTYTTPILRTDGTFNEDIYVTGHAYGWANEDGSVEYTVNEGNLYYTDENGTELIAENYTPGLNAKILFIDGVFALVDLKRLNYPDGEWETTDVPKAVTILKASLDTGYGYIAKDGAKYVLTGFLPETKIDFPNNILQSMMAYNMAIDFRTKANSDTTDLRNARDDLKGQYVATLSSDGFAYPTIRNVRNVYGHLMM